MLAAGREPSGIVVPDGLRAVDLMSTCGLAISRSALAPG
jgi:hypothetical protein